MRAASHDKTQLKDSVFAKLVCDDVLVWELNGDKQLEILLPSKTLPKQQRDHCQRNHSDRLLCELMLNLPKYELPDWWLHQFTGTMQLQHCRMSL